VWLEIDLTRSLRTRVTAPTAQVLGLAIPHTHAPAPLLATPAAPRHLVFQVLLILQVVHMRVLQGLRVVRMLNTADYYIPHI